MLIATFKSVGHDLVGVLVVQSGVLVRLHFDFRLFRFLVGSEALGTAQVAGHSHDHLDDGQDDERNPLLLGADLRIFLSLLSLQNLDEELVLSKLHDGQHHEEVDSDESRHGAVEAAACSQGTHFYLFF